MAVHSWGLIIGWVSPFWTLFFFLPLPKNGVIEIHDPLLNNAVCLFPFLRLCLSLSLCSPAGFLSAPFSSVTKFLLLLIEWALLPRPVGIIRFGNLETNSMPITIHLNTHTRTERSGLCKSVAHGSSEKHGGRWMGAAAETNVRFRRRTRRKEVDADVMSQTIESKILSTVKMSVQLKHFFFFSPSDVSVF